MALAVEVDVFKALREWWMYWRYRNITRRWQLLRPRLRFGRPRPIHSGPARVRGTAMYMPTRSSTNPRGLIFVTVAAAVLAVVNVLLGPGQHFVLDAILFGVMAYAYVQYSGF